MNLWNLVEAKLRLFWRNHNPGPTVRDDGTNNWMNKNTYGSFNRVLLTTGDVGCKIVGRDNHITGSKG